MHEEAEQLSTLIRERYDALDSDGAVVIRPADIADHVYEIIDPSRKSPILVQFAAILELRQLARAVCRKRYQDDQQTTEQVSLFEMQLQPRYPASRDDDDVYVLRAHLTIDERRYNINRLRKEASAKTAHADALEAETDQLIRSGALVGEVQHA